MHQFTTATDPTTLASGYSFEINTSNKHRDSLSRMVLTNAGLIPGQLVLELSCSGENSSKLMSTVYVAETDPFGGFPQLLEITAEETGFGKSGSSVMLPWARDSFDTILCIGIFNHLSDHSETMEAMHNILVSEGKLIIADQWFRNAVPMFSNLLQPYMRSSDFRIYSPASVSRVLKKSGFCSIETKPAGTTNFLCTAIAVK